MSPMSLEASPSVTRLGLPDCRWRCHTPAMREHATLKLTDGREMAVEVGGHDLDQDEIVVHRTSGARDAPDSFLEVIDAHLRTAEPHPAGTTDRALEEDRSRPY